jgi:gamma-glutamylcyclotransferase (GGCT)/AIG2-like uncharacterized protein YtfP
MSADLPALAVYGTLRRGEQNESFLDGADYLGMGVISGTMHDVPRTPYREYPYPALLPEPAGDVVVELYRLPDAATLSRLDELEMYLPDDEPGSQYLRRVVPVRHGPVADAFVYFYVGPREELGVRIVDGDWVTFTASRE